MSKKNMKSENAEPKRVPWAILKDDSDRLNNTLAELKANIDVFGSRVYYGCSHTELQRLAGEIESAAIALCRSAQSTSVKVDMLKAQ